MEELVSMAEELASMDALGGMSDHGVSKSLYGQDPDGIEFEVMYRVPREYWGEYERKAVVKPLDLHNELQRFGADSRT
jgi:catechol-2,3-dioxygenase